MTRPATATARTLPGIVAVAAVLLAAATLAACAGSGSNDRSSISHQPASSGATPGRALASASVGTLVITGGYIRQPASPDVAAAYLTITNNGATADRLEKVTTSVTSTVMPMTETDRGGVGSMSDLSNITIPGHGRMQFTPNHAHLMLENPKPLKAGSRVSMTLTFAHAGTVTITLPVIPLGQTPGTSGMTGPMTH